MSYLKVTDAQTAYKAAIGQDLMRQFRDNQEDHESRISQLLAQSHNTLIDDFLCFDDGGGGGAVGIDEDLYALAGGASDFRPQVGVDGKHVLRVNTVNSSITKRIASKNTKLAFRLNQDLVGTFEARITDVGAAAPTNLIIGFSANLAPSNEDDVIAFLKGTTAGKWRFRVAKATVATTTDNIGNRATYQKLRIDLLRSGGGSTLQVRAYIDGGEISGSPFTTNIPDTTVLRMIFGSIGPGSGTTDVQLDRWEMRWTAIPVQA